MQRHCEGGGHLAKAEAATTNGYEINVTGLLRGSRGNHLILIQRMHLIQ